MIEKLILKNIQSHKDSTLEFHPNINVIIGSSNNGKSSILRGFNWVKNNRPLGTDTLASHWIVNEKGNLKKPMEVELVTNGNTIKRRRDKDVNQYIVNDLELNVVKTDIPDDVERVLALTETNVQNQHDAPFLLSKSSGEVAKYFNKVVNLDIIDRVLNNVEKEKRKVKNGLDNKMNDLAEIENSISDYDWLNEIDEKIEKLEVIKSKVEKLEVSIVELKSQIEILEKLKVLKSEMDKVKIIQKNIVELENLFKIQKIIICEINNLTSSLNKLENTKVYNLDEVFKLMSELSNNLYRLELMSVKTVELSKQILELRKTLEFKVIDFKKVKVLVKDIEFIKLDDSFNLELSHYLARLNRYGRLVTKNLEEISGLKTTLPEICPLCNNILKI